MAISSVVAAGRRLLAQTLLDRAFVRDRSIIRDTSGGKKEVWTERSTSVAARYTAMTDDEAEIALSSVYGRPNAMLLLPLGTVAREGDRVRNPADGRIWVITRCLTPPSELALSERFGIAEVVT